MTEANARLVEASIAVLLLVGGVVGALLRGLYTAWRHSDKRFIRRGEAYTKEEADGRFVIAKVHEKEHAAILQQIAAELAHLRELFTEKLSQACPLRARMNAEACEKSSKEA